MAVIALVGAGATILGIRRFLKRMDQAMANMAEFYMLD